MKGKGCGWHNESQRHRMSAYGIKTSQLTTKTSKHPYVKRLVEVAIESTGVDDSKLKFSISDKHDHAYYVDSKVYLPTDLSFYYFLENMMHEMIHHDLIDDEWIMDKNMAEVESEVIKRTGIAMENAKQYLKPEEVEDIEETQREIEELKRRFR